MAHFTFLQNLSLFSFGGLGIGPVKAFLNLRSPGVMLFYFVNDNLFNFMRL